MAINIVLKIKSDQSVEFVQSRIGSRTSSIKTVKTSKSGTSKNQELVSFFIL